MSLHSKLAAQLMAHHPEDAAKALESLDSAEAARLLGPLPPATAARILDRVTSQPAARILASCPAEGAARIVEQLPVLAAATYLRRLDDETRQAVVAALGSRSGRALRSLLKHREDTAGAVMEPQILAVPEDLTVKGAVDRVRESGGDARYNVYVTDRDDRLVGVINLRELLLAKPQQRLSSIVTRNVESLPADADVHEIVSHPGWRRLHVLPVVDERGVYLGAIRHRTLWRLLDRLQTDASSPEERVRETSQALGGLFWAGVAGMLDAMAGPPANGTRGDREGRRRP